MKISGAQLIVEMLKKEGITTVAGMPGGSNLPLYDALSKSDIQHILIKHEQAAGFIAQGIARTTGNVGVCMATSGPGSTNLITAIADAHLDSIPLIAITGQVPTGMIGTDAFQEVDTFGITVPICKHNYIIKDAAELLEVLPQAFYIARSGRPGPVIIDVPKDVQLQMINCKKLPDTIPTPSPEQPNTHQLKRITDRINQSSRPIFLIGGGIIHSTASQQLINLAKKNAIPIVSTLMGLGAVPNQHPLFVGMLGMHGFKQTNQIMAKADLIIAIGTRLGDRATGRVNAFCPGADLIHIDIDTSEINKIKAACLALQADAGAALQNMLPHIQMNDRPEWVKQVTAIRDTRAHPQYMPLHPIAIIKQLSDLSAQDAIIVTDVGQHQMWTAQHFDFKQPRTFLTSGGLGTMGFGLPTAIGAALANPDKQIICISGDGSILMNIQEFATLTDLQLNIKVIILNNQYLGLVRQQQELFYNQNHAASRFEHQYNFAAIAQAFGLTGVKITTTEEISAQLKTLLNTPDTTIIDINVSETHHVLPMVIPGKSNEEMIEEEL